jgi:hypothetical protein
MRAIFEAGSSDREILGRVVGHVAGIGRTRLASAVAAHCARFA